MAKTKGVFGVLIVLCLLVSSLLHPNDIQAATGNPLVDTVCPCDANWKSHGEYVSCVAKAARDISVQGQTIDNIKVVTRAAKSSCGQKPKDVLVLATTTKTVSATQGGTLTLLSGEKLVIPPGALAEDTDITLRTIAARKNNTTSTSTIPDPLTTPLPPGYVSAGTIVELLPDGLPFQPELPAVLTLPVNSQNLSDSTHLIYVFDGTQWVPVPSIEEEAESPSQEVDSATQTVTASLSHFSTYEVILRSDIQSWWSQAVGVPGMVIGAPFDTSKCTRCTARSTPISQIIVHSTNNNPKTSFVGLLAWILGSLGTKDTNGKSTEAFFATYYIDRDGRIARLVSDNIQTSHIGGHNSGTIGIELFDGQSNWTSYTTPPPVRTPPYTDAQMTALRSLIQSLRTQYNLPTNSVCTHRHFTSNAKHQDPYKIGDGDFHAFLASFGLSPCGGGCTDTYPNVIGIASTGMQTAGFFDTEDTGAHPGPISFSASGNSASASASGTKGDVSVRATSTELGMAEAVIRYSDTLLITSESTTGQGQATFNWNLNTSTSNGYVSAGASTDDGTFSAWYDDPPQFPNASSTFTFTYGTPIKLGFEIVARAGLKYGPASASAQGGYTITPLTGATISWCRATH